MGRIKKVLEIGPYPPPRAGWAIRIEFVRRRIEQMGHVCQALNIGKSRREPSDEYITVNSGLDYLAKVLWYSARGYTIHMHANGDSPKGFVLSLLALAVGCLFGRRGVLTFHAGTHQVYFPRDRSGRLFRVFYWLFKLPKTIICNSPAVSQKIQEYGISARKIVPIPAFSRQYVEYEDVALPNEVEGFLGRHDPLIFTYVFLRDGYYIDTLVEGMRLVRERWPRAGLVNVGSLDDSEEPTRSDTTRHLARAGLAEHVCFTGDLTHEQFLSLLARTRLYLRTPTTDGVCSSVLESLTLGVPVVAAENGHRPPSVVTYPAMDAAAMCERVCDVLADPDRYRSAIVRPAIHDTVEDEAELLVGNRSVEVCHAEAQA
jgi:glycosyltransferase involved in cell wall biosynthesis